MFSKHNCGLNHRHLMKQKKDGEWGNWISSPCTDGDLDCRPWLGFVANDCIVYTSLQLCYHNNTSPRSLSQAIYKSLAFVHKLRKPRQPSTGVGPEPGHKMYPRTKGRGTLQNFSSFYHKILTWTNFPWDGHRFSGNMTVTPTALRTFVKQDFTPGLFCCCCWLVVGFFLWW